MTKRYSIRVQGGLFWILVFLVLRLSVRPLAAASQTRTPDVARINAFVSAQVQRHGIPGLALGVVDGDQIIDLQGFGKADESGQAVTPQTPFILASISKPMTSLAIMQLVEAGKVELDAPVQRYMPDFRVADPVASAQITVRNLLLQTSGLPVTACDTRIDADTLEQYVAELQPVKLAAPVGARFIYCSGNYNVLGRIIETVSGQSYASYIQQHLFTPLEMHHSFTAEQQAQPDGLAEGHDWLFGLVVPIHYRYNPSQLPSGMLIASAEDMTHFLIAQLNGGRFGSATLVSPEGITTMHTPGVPIGAAGQAYGLGWYIETLGGVPIIQHPGAEPNYRTFLFLEPQTRRGAVILINANGAVADIQAFSGLEEGVARLLAGQEPAPASPLTVPLTYLIIDLLLALLLALALWPLLRMRRWYQRLQQRYHEGRLRVWPVGLRIGWEFALPLALLIGTRMFFTALGAQSWYEGLQVLPDFGAWLWVISLLLLLTGAIHFVLLLRLLRRNGSQHEMAPPAAPTTVS